MDPVWNRRKIESRARDCRGVCIADAKLHSFSVHFGMHACCNYIRNKIILNYMQKGRASRKLVIRKR